MSRTPEEPGAPERLDSAHDLAAFDSGEPLLDDWLRRRALADGESGVCRTYVTSVAGRVVGYHALATGAVVSKRTMGKTRRSPPDPEPVMILGRLAVDKAHQGKGVGVGLLRDALLRMQQAASLAGVRAIVLHPISEAGRRFYERCGFTATPIDPLSLMVSIPEVERILRDR